MIYGMKMLISVGFLILTAINDQPNYKDKNNDATNNSHDCTVCFLCLLISFLYSLCHFLYFFFQFYPFYCPWQPFFCRRCSSVPRFISLMFISRRLWRTGPSPFPSGLISGRRDEGFELLNRMKIRKTVVVRILASTILEVISYVLNI